MPACFATDLLSLAVGWQSNPRVFHPQHLNPLRSAILISRPGAAGLKSQGQALGLVKIMVII
ncbi:protein of unknown function [Pseudomonas marincola]|uniref:Uncharacterized protein n=1 Tax=Pseudomonas marincola TaxID=437900 RepID=A0A8S2BBI4_9PSED|nr:protein of unknown function [Pseudomonas marincola]